MLVTASRLHAVRYKIAFDEYIKRRGYENLRTLVAFSGTVNDDSIERKETAMNDGLQESRLPKEFDKDDCRILIVANKYQTGFDQPKLHTMYVDKKLSGVKAVQTLSRLNRIHAGKEDTFVLDFVNDPEDILASFMPFYKTTKLDKDIDPNEIYTIERTIYDKQVINKVDVVHFTDIIFKEKHTKNDAAIMNQLVDNSVDRMKDFKREELLDFRNLTKKFINLYNLIIQVAPIVDADLHRLSVYLRFLIKKIEVEGPTGVDITDKILLEYYRLEQKTEGSITYGDDDPKVVVQVGGGSVREPESDYLSSIIDKLNEKFGTNFSDSEKLAVEQIRTSLSANAELGKKAVQNNYDDFKYAFGPAFLDGVMGEYEKNETFYGKILSDESFRDKLMDLMMLEIYSKFNGTEEVQR